jgi:lipopolysaccharide export system protein LptA
VTFHALRLRLAVVGSLLGGARFADAQVTRCETQNAPQTSQQSVQLPSGEYNHFLGNGGIVVLCPEKKITLRADSAEIYGDERRIYLLGHVHYNEPRLDLSSDFLTYYQTDERIVASGNVDARLPTGSTLKGPEADYRRAVPRIRTRAQTLATGRPTVTIVQRDKSGKEEDPINVVANTIFMDGDSLIYGSGMVEITRPDIHAKSDSAFINVGTETMQLVRNPVVEGTRRRPFKLVGDLIDLFSRDRKLQRVVARSKAEAVSQDMTLRADTIDLRVVDDQLQRAFAWGASRARVTSPAQNMTADSLDVRMPGQRVREVHALRKAFAEGRPDTTKFRADTTDWLRGDTIVAYFDSLPAVDTTKGPAIRKLISTDSASAYYNMAPSDTTLRRSAINYVTGRKITIDVNEGRVASIAVDGNVAGMYIEPTASDTATARATTRSGAPVSTPGRPRPVPVPGATGVRRP